MRFISFLLCLFMTSAADAHEVNIYILAGQSNAHGPPDYVYTARPADARVRLYYELGDIAGSESMTANEVPPGNNPALPRWLQNYPLGVQLLAPVSMGGASWAGPEITFGRNVYNKFGPLYYPVIAKFAIRGSGMHLHWMNSISVDLSDRLLMFISRVQQDIIKAGHTPVIRGLLWIQGERDSAGPQGYADAYAANLRRLVIKVRGFAGSKTLPVVIARTRIEPKTPQLDAVRSAQDSFVMADSCAAIVNTDDLVMRSDGFHFVPSEYDKIGGRLFNAFSVILQRTECH